MVGCGSTDTQESGTTVTLGAFSYSPAPAVVGVPFTITGTISSQGHAASTATWSAVRDGSVVVDTGTLHIPSEGGSVPVSFDDTVPTPGSHQYVVTLQSNGRSSRTNVTIPIAYGLTPDMSATAVSATSVVLTLTVTNTGSGEAAFAVAGTVTDTQGMTAGSSLIFDFSNTPLVPGASQSQSITVDLPISGNDTYWFTIDALRTLGTNLAGEPARISLPFGSG
jgi:hypothetical protein